MLLVAVRKEIKFSEVCIFYIKDYVLLGYINYVRFWGCNGLENKKL